MSEIAQKQEKIATEDFKNNPAQVEISPEDNNLLQAKQPSAVPDVFKGTDDLVITKEKEGGFKSEEGSLTETPEGHLSGSVGSMDVQVWETGIKLSDKNGDQCSVEFVDGKNGSTDLKVTLNGKEYRGYASTLRDGGTQFGMVTTDDGTKILVYDKAAFEDYEAGQSGYLIAFSGAKGKVIETFNQPKVDRYGHETKGPRIFIDSPTQPDPGFARKRLLEIAENRSKIGLDTVLLGLSEFPKQ